MIVQFRNEKVSNHSSIPITIDCNVVAFIVFEEGFHQPIKRTKQSASNCLRLGTEKGIPAISFQPHSVYELIYSIEINVQQGVIALGKEEAPRLSIGRVPLSPNCDLVPDEFRPRVAGKACALLVPERKSIEFRNIKQIYEAKGSIHHLSTGNQTWQMQFESRKDNHNRPAMKPSLSRILLSSTPVKKARDSHNRALCNLSTYPRPPK
ncbi:hypothetical protein TNCV_3012391 [Trichonephila clavipes]|nr:hypothetical protein TNCV_3012391 [Trichonephila clavipes]